MIGSVSLFFSIDNQLYTVAGDDVLERTGCSQLPQSQEHEYEFDNSVDEIGAYGEMVSV